MGSISNVLFYFNFLVIDMDLNAWHECEFNSIRLITVRECEEIGGTCKNIS